jgi:DNA polymerase sigma
VADFDLRPERRERLAASLRDALTAVIPGSQAGLRGSLDADTADQYSDIDLCWVAPDDTSTTAINAATKALGPVAGERAQRGRHDEG